MSLLRTPGFASEILSEPSILSSAADLIWLIQHFNLVFAIHQDTWIPIFQERPDDISKPLFVIQTTFLLHNRRRAHSSFSLGLLPLRVLSQRVLPLFGAHLTDGWEVIQQVPQLVGNHHPYNVFLAPGRQALRTIIHSLNVTIPRRIS